MAPDYNTLPMRGHVVHPSFRKKISTMWRVISEIVAFVVDGGGMKKMNRRDWLTTVGQFGRLSHISNCKLL
jgi:hypothetical protein